jgi:hypothetical protein
MSHKGKVASVSLLLHRVNNASRGNPKANYVVFGFSTHFIIDGVACLLSICHVLLNSLPMCKLRMPFPFCLLPIWLYP